MVSQGLSLPDTGRIADENLGRAVDPLRPTNATGYSCRKDGNPLVRLGVCAPQFLHLTRAWHVRIRTGMPAGLPPEGVERQTKGKNNLPSGGAFRAFACQSMRVAVLNHSAVYVFSTCLS